MIRAANHSSFPKLGETPLDQQLRVTSRRHAAGRATADDLAAALEAAIGIAVADQSRAFVDVVTDGMVAWDGPLAHLASNLEGLRPAELLRWFHTNFYDRRPEVTGEIRRRAPFLDRDYLVAKAISVAKPVKVALPGPVLFARMARDRHYGDRGTVARAVAAALAEEVAHLAGLGAKMFQLDESLLCRHPEDAGLVAETARTVFDAAGPEATTILATSFGDLAALGGDLSKLPGTHLGLDLVSTAGNYTMIDALPDGRGVQLGLFDATTTCQEDAGDVAAKLAPHRESLQRRDVLVGPNAGLELLPRDAAFDKLLHARYLTEQLRREWTWRS